MKLERKDCRFPLDTVDVYKEVMRLSLTFPWRRRIEIIFIGPNPCDFLIFPPPARSSHSCPVHCIIALFKKQPLFFWKRRSCLFAVRNRNCFRRTLASNRATRLVFGFTIFTTHCGGDTISLFWNSAVFWNTRTPSTARIHHHNLSNFSFYISNQKFRQFSPDKVKKKVIFSGIFHRHKYLKFIENILWR